MSLLEEIYEWSQTLKACLRDALRRLLETPNLSAEDYDDLFALLKLEVGINDEKNRVAQPLRKTHLPSVAAKGSAVRLLSIKNLRNVNRIAPNQKIEFEPAGLTVIYGDNGTGKSGYSRVLKLACRARGEKAAVLPNANLTKDEQGPPEADIVFDLSGALTKFKWTGGIKEHPELASVSVFDCHCARAYLDDEQDVAYLPYGLDIVENLANVVLPELNKRLNAAITACAVDSSQFEELTGKTKVGQMIETLSKDTDPALVETLSTFTEQDSAQFSRLEKTLSEQNPKEKAAQLRRLAGRLTTLKETIDTVVDAVNKSAVGTLQTLVTETIKATAAEEIARNALQAGESLLPSTGSDEWCALFKAARAFAAAAYEDKQFPPSSSAAKCPLCQQELKDGAGRLNRFDTFINDAATMAADSKRSALGRARKALEDAKLAIVIDPSLAEEIDAVAPDMCPAIRTLETIVGRRRAWMVDSSKSNSWVAVYCSRFLRKVG